MAKTAPIVLLVEDEESTAFIESLILKRAGFQVEQVGLGRHALEYLAGREQPALVVLDYFLPDMTGGDVVAALGDRISDLPVIMVTGHPDPVIAERLLAAGVLGYIVKDRDSKYLDRLVEAARAVVESPG